MSHRERPGIVCAQCVNNLEYTSLNSVSVMCNRVTLKWKVMRVAGESYVKNYETYFSLPVTRCDYLAPST